jgi:hypothetical protein
MENLTDYLNAEKSDLMEVLFSKNLPQGRQTREWFDAARTKVKAEVEPAVLAHLDSLQLKTLAAGISSIEELETITLKLLPPNFNVQLAISLDGLEEFNMPQKFWTFSVMLDDFARSTAEYARTIFHQRAQEIVKFRNRLVLP